VSGPADRLILVISGPSGVGKTTVIARLLEDPAFGRSITATTRAPRAGEREGVDYLFLPRETFVAGIAAGRFLEHAEVHGNYYGTPRDGVDAVLAAGRTCILNIDVQGAESLRRTGLPVATVFLMPPSIEELERRLGRRGTEEPSEMHRRLAQARREMAEADRFERKIVNHSVDGTVEQIRGFVADRVRRSA
jgi:guanylate kinase